MTPNQRFKVAEKFVGSIVNREMLTDEEFYGYVRWVSPQLDVGTHKLTASVIQNMVNIEKNVRNSSIQEIADRFPNLDRIITNLKSDYTYLIRDRL